MRHIDARSKIARRPIARRLRLSVGGSPVVAAVAVILLLALGTGLLAPALAQRRPELPKKDVPVGFVLARLKYSGGGDWYSNPSSLPNLLRALGERTTVPVASTEERRVAITDEELFTYPFLYMNGHGTVRFSEDEAERLRRYLTSGGFLFADDNYGMDQSFRQALRRVFPDQSLVEVPLDHPIYRAFYDLSNGLPKVHEHDGQEPVGLGIFHEGRLVLFYSYEADIGDGLEDAGVHRDPPNVREAALQMAINIVVYALTS